MSTVDHTLPPVPAVPEADGNRWDHTESLDNVGSLALSAPELALQSLCGTRPGGRVGEGGGASPPPCGNREAGSLTGGSRADIVASDNSLGTDSLPRKTREKRRPKAKNTVPADAEPVFTVSEPEPFQRYWERVFRLRQLSLWSWEAIGRADERINRQGPTWDGKPLGTRAIALYGARLAELSNSSPRAREPVDCDYSIRLTSFLAKAPLPCITHVSLDFGEEPGRVFPEELMQRAIDPTLQSDMRIGEVEYVFEDGEYREVRRG